MVFWTGLQKRLIHMFCTKYNSHSPLNVFHMFVLTAIHIRLITYESHVRA